MSKILIIDDDNQMREMLRQMMDRAGYETSEAPNGKVGMQIMHSADVDLVITDLYMPEKEGLETVTELRRDFPQVKIIAISGGYRSGFGSHLPIAKELGADRIFKKPFGRDEILDAVRSLLAPSG